MSGTQSTIIHAATQVFCAITGTCSVRKKPPCPCELSSALDGGTLWLDTIHSTFQVY